MTKTVKEFLLDQASGDVSIEYSDNSTTKYNLSNAVTATQSAQGVGITSGDKTVGVNVKFLGKKPAFARCIASNFASPIAADAKCYGHAIAMPGKFEAVRISFVHVGGAGAVVGMTAAVAATDDVGDRSNTNTPAGRRFATPYRSGVEKNEFSADGWARVTVGGATSWGIADPGGNNINIARSDIVEVHGIEDSLNPGVYPLLVRAYGGMGVFTRTGNTGFADPTRFLAEAGKIYAMGCSRVGAADAIGTLANWSNISNVGFSDADCIAMIIEAWSADGVKTVMLIGDSRFALPAPSLESTVSYRGTGFVLEKALADSGKKAAVARCARGAQTNATIDQWANSYYDNLIVPDVAVRLCYSINNGVPTAALLSTEKTRILKALDADLSRGVIPVLVPIFPYGTGYGAALPAVLEFNAWCKSLGAPYVDALERYGDSLGGWKAGYNEDANHMTNSGYADLGGVALRDAVLALI